MITSFALEFDNFEEMDKVAYKLWNKMKITGEIEMVPLANGKWRLNVHSEKAVRQSTIDGLAGKQVSVKDFVSTHLKDATEDD